LGTNALVYLAGLRIPDEDERELAKLVDEPIRSFLEKALAMETEVAALTVADRERILWALDDSRSVLSDDRGPAPARGLLISVWRTPGANAQEPTH
jgi:hypothetical protein